MKNYVKITGFVCLFCVLLSAPYVCGQTTEEIVTTSISQPTTQPQPQTTASEPPRPSTSPPETTTLQSTRPTTASFQPETTTPQITGPPSTTAPPKTTTPEPTRPITTTSSAGTTTPNPTRLTTTTFPPQTTSPEPTRSTTTTSAPGTTTPEPTRPTTATSAPEPTTPEPTRPTLTASPPQTTTPESTRPPTTTSSPAITTSEPTGPTITTSPPQTTTPELTRPPTTTSSPGITTSEPTRPTITTSSPQTTVEPTRPPTATFPPGTTTSQPSTPTITTSAPGLTTPEPTSPTITASPTETITSKPTRPITTTSPPQTTTPKPTRPTTTTSPPQTTTPEPTRPATTTSPPQTTTPEPTTTIISEISTQTTTPSPEPETTTVQTSSVQTTTTTTQLPTTTELPEDTDPKPCVLRDYHFNSYVCVCNSTYCDNLPPIERLARGKYAVYSSNRVGRRFHKEEGRFKPGSSTEPADALIYINPTVKFQKIKGMGATLTDASGININSLESSLRLRLLRSYFSPYGIEYTLLQVPIGSTDFSTRPYTYHETNDPELKDFELAPEDYYIKIPLIKEVQVFRSDLELIAAPWAAPGWMKSNGKIGGPGIVQLPMYQPWANYLIKFLDAYQNHGLSFWALTTGNEPNLGRTATSTPSVGWIATQQANWLENNIGPTLRERHQKVQLLAVDDKRKYLPNYADSMFFARPGARRFVDGIGVHWDDMDKTPSDVLSMTYEKYEAPIITTSARAESRSVTGKVQLGVWDHAEHYIENIIDDVNNWSTGWVDSNLALNLEGGPSFVKAAVEAAVIVNPKEDEFYKQPIYYAQGHVSKFVPPGSRRILRTTLLTKAKVAAFVRPDGGIAVVILNREIIEQNVQINDAESGHLVFKAAPRSISTVVYW